MGKGLRHDPLADIELIRQNLKDRYSAGFPVIRELLQNADDANATRVELIWTPGMKEAAHPLLRGPSFIAINDGQFRDTDRDAVRLMGLSDKLRERESIGKFGLGLKSVFHWCEAFFYLVRRPETTAIEGDILNPWSGESGTRSFHGEWDDFSGEDKTAITAHLKFALSQPTWFCLWIPLRRKTHCRTLAAIQRAFPGDLPGAPDFLTAPDLDRRLTEVLPLLAHLRTIRVWLLSGQAQLEPAITIALLDGAHRRRYRRNASFPIGSQPMSGELRSSTRGIHWYRGQEAVVAEAALFNIEGFILLAKGHTH